MNRLSLLPHASWNTTYSERLLDTLYDSECHIPFLVRLDLVSSNGGGLGKPLSLQLASRTHQLVVSEVGCSQLGVDIEFHMG